MTLDVSSIQASYPPNIDGSHHAATPHPSPVELASEAAKAAAGLSPAQLQTAIRGLEGASAAFNRRLSFTVNEKLGEVVVKVIDTDTDKVVREIPPVELQRVYERIREVIGLLFDKQA
jgi:flagellar protein FlaG